MRSRRNAGAGSSEHELSSAAKTTGGRAHSGRAANTHDNLRRRGHREGIQGIPSRVIPSEQTRPANEILGRNRPSRAPGPKMKLTKQWRYKQETPPSTGPAARCEGVRGSGFDRVATLSVLALGGGNGQSHLLADGAGQEARARNAAASQWPSSALLR